jgi:hypothetical protein
MQERRGREIAIAIETDQARSTSER